MPRQRERESLYLTLMRKNIFSFVGGVLKQFVVRASLLGGSWCLFQLQLYLYLYLKPYYGTYGAYKWVISTVLTGE